MRENPNFASANTVGIYDDLGRGRSFGRNKMAVNVMVDLTKQVKSGAIQAIE